MGGGRAPWGQGVAALAPYTLEGAYGRLLDAASEELASADALHVEMEELMPHKALVPPVLTYLFHRLEARFDGRPTLLGLSRLRAPRSHTRARLSPA